MTATLGSPPGGNHLRTLLLFVATTSLCLPALLGVAAASPAARAEILSPASNATVGVNMTVSLRYSDYAASSGTAYGYVLLGGEWATGFSAPLPPVGPAIFNVTFDASGFAGGEYAITARVFTQANAAVDTPPVTVVLDLPPQLSAAASYDVETRDVIVAIHAQDEAPVALTLRSSWVLARATASGATSLRAHLPLPVGNHRLTLDGQDAMGQVTTIVIPFEVHDRPASVTDLVASYWGWGILDITANISDADGVEDVSISGESFRETFGATPEGKNWAGVAIVRRVAGVFNGSIEVTDRFGGVTRVPFTYQIGGAPEVLYERVFPSELSTVSQGTEVIELPAISQGRMEICVGLCDDVGGLVPGSAQLAAAPGTLLAWWLDPLQADQVEEAAADHPVVCTGPVATTCPLEAIDQVTLTASWALVGGAAPIRLRVVGIAV